MRNRIKRKIIRTDIIMNRGCQKSRHTGGSLIFTLQCGHTNRSKLSEGKPKTGCVFCYICGRLAGGARSGSLDRETGMWTIETMDLNGGQIIRTKATQEQFDAYMQTGELPK